ncbi:MAG: TOBE domain-containing protein [Gammaproteobacteria bacterium]|nr:TOBE domain-containing protein [Gammaproteobacteria bacterium]NNC57656.1 TOBE domain-containing protein [Woeseiaceae bacterium]NNL49599.1 TOBE domain-containing protein [Woeseiaceae bacterium]
MKPWLETLPPSEQDTGAVVEAQPKGYDEEYDLMPFDLSGSELWVAGRYDKQVRSVRLRIATHDVSLCRAMPESAAILNAIAAEVEDIQSSTAASALVQLRVCRDVLLAQVTRRSVARLDLKNGDKVFAQVKSVSAKR